MVIRFSPDARPEISARTGRARTKPKTRVIKTANNLLIGPTGTTSFGPESDLYKTHQNTRKALLSSGLASYPNRFASEMLEPKIFPVRIKLQSAQPKTQRNL